MGDSSRQLWLVTEYGEYWLTDCFHNRAWPDNEWHAKFDDDYSEHRVMGVDVFEDEMSAVVQAIKNIDKHIETVGDRRAEVSDRLFVLLCGETLEPSFKERRKARKAAQSSK